MYWVYNSQGPVARLHQTLQCKTRNVTLGGVEMIAKISRRTLRRQKQDQGQQRTMAGARSDQIGRMPGVLFTTKTRFDPLFR